MSTEEIRAIEPCEAVLEGIIYVEPGEQVERIEAGRLGGVIPGVWLRMASGAVDRFIPASNLRSLTVAKPAASSASAQSANEKPTQAQKGR